MLESKRRAIIFISISLLLAVVAGFMFLMKVNELNDNLGGTTKVYVASKAIDSRTIISPDDVKIIDLPNKFVVDDYIEVDEAEQITNKVSIVPIAAETIITKSILKEFSNVGDPNNRKVALMWSEKVSFDDNISDQDRVDIVVSHQFDGKPKTEIFMSDVLVFKVLGSGKESKGIHLEVSKADAAKLIHMQNYADSIRILKANVGQEQPKQGAAKEIPEKKPVEPIVQPDPAAQPGQPTQPPSQPQG